MEENKSYIVFCEYGLPGNEGFQSFRIRDDATVTIQRIRNERTQVFEGELEHRDLDDFILLLNACKPCEIRQDSSILADPSDRIYIHFYNSTVECSAELVQSIANEDPCLKELISAFSDISNKVSGGMVSL